MELDVNISGQPELKKKLDELARLYPDALGAALYQEGMTVWRDAVKKAPVEFGVLRNSAYVSPPMERAGELSVEIGFGTRYAVYQEQREGLNHPRGGQAHYLRSTLDQLANGYLERVAARTEENVKNGVRAPAIAAPTQPSVSGSSRRRGLRQLRKRRTST